MTSDEAAEPGPASAESVVAALRRYEPKRMSIPTFRAAAVLVPVVQREGRLELWLTVRAAGLSSHAGQIAFPGGALEPGEDAVEAALRETFEEIGLRIPRADVVGTLDDQPSPAGYVATPVVALLNAAVEPVPNPAEVAEVFAVPVLELRKIAPSWEERTLDRFRRRIHFYPWRQRLIWGFTGNVVRNFLEVTSASTRE